MAVQDLIDVFHRMADMYDQMLELSEKKRKVIILNDMKKLNQIVAEETGLIKQMGALEQLRDSAVNRFLIFKGYNANTVVTLSEIVRMVSHSGQKMMLLYEQARLNNSIAALEQSNAMNQTLLQDALQYIDSTINLLVGSADEDAFYRIPSKNGTTLCRAGFFDLRT